MSDEVFSCGSTLAWEASLDRLGMGSHPASLELIRSLFGRLTGGPVAECLSKRTWASADFR